MFWKRKQPYITYLPEPTDATIGILKHVVQQRASIPSFKMGLSSLEAPSTRLAIELFQRETYGHAQVEIDVAELQHPDPRLPHGPVNFVLWHYNGTTPSPAISPPASDIARQVAAFAETPYDLPRWIKQAQQLGHSLGTTAISDLLGVMIHPPQRPPKIPVWVWLFQVQVAAAYTIAFIDTGWEQSIRKTTLFSLARGPMDWSVTAAVLALQQVARHEPASREDTSQLYLELLHTLPRPGGIPYLDALVWCISDSLSWLAEPLRSDLVRRARAEIAP
jgi:hypothetical protein